MAIIITRGSCNFVKLARQIEMPCVEKGVHLESIETRRWRCTMINSAARKLANNDSEAPTHNYCNSSCRRRRLRLSVRLIPRRLIRPSTEHCSPYTNNLWRTQSEASASCSTSGPGWPALGRGLSGGECAAAMRRWRFDADVGRVRRGVKWSE